MPEKPLVSVCTTFFRAERYIYRVLESVLQQTYANVELVVVDGASTDGSAEIVKQYAARDPRITYVRVEEGTFPERLRKSFELAHGKFVMMIGADDWIARDYIEKGIETFEEFPDAAGVIPRLVSLLEDKPDHFILENEVFGEFSRPKAYPASWFAKEMYRPTHLYISALALIRKEDAVASFNYFLTHYPTSEAVTPELRSLFTQGFGIDAVMFLEILSRHERFIFSSALCHLKTMGGQTIHFDLGQESLTKVLTHYYQYLTTFSFMYKAKWPSFYRGMKLFLGTEALTSLFIRFIRTGPRKFFADIQQGKSESRRFFKEFSWIERVVCSVRAVGRLGRRGLEFLLRRLRKGGVQSKDQRDYFSRNYFLDASGNFTAN